MGAIKSFFAKSVILDLLGLAAYFFTLYLGSAGWGIFLLSVVLIILFEYFFRFFKGGKLTPYLLMVFSPLLLVHYSSIQDFRIRLLCFLFLVYIFSAACAAGIKKIGFSLTRTAPFLVWLTGFALFSLAAVILYTRGIHLSGDEPHYIMIAQSIVEDGDFDLKNQMEGKSYFKYLPVEIKFHGGDYQGKYRSFHMPGVSFLLLPFYWFFNLLGGAIPARLYFRLAAALINAFFALGLFQLLKSKFPDKNITGFWLLFLITFPLSFHAVHLYPELPAAALMMFGYIFAFHRNEKKNLLFSGLFLSLIPWFHIKYMPALVVLALFILYRLVRERNIKSIVYFVLFPLFSFLLLLIYSKVLYGSLNPAHIFPAEGYFVVPLLARLRTLFAYFFDQRDGLLCYAPLFFLAFLGLKRSFHQRGILAAVAAAYILLHANTSVRGAYSPAGRPIIFVSWILIILVVNYFYSTESRTIPRLLTGFSFFILAWLFYYPLFVYQPVFSYTTERGSDLLTFFSSSWLDLCRFFPSFLSTRSNWLYPANYVWLGLFTLILSIFYLPRAKSPVRSLLEKGKMITASILFLLLSSLLCFYPHVHLIPQNKFVGKTFSFYNNSRNFRFLPDQDLFRIKAGPSYDIFFDLKYSRQEPIRFHFINTDQVGVTVRNTDRLLFQSNSREHAHFTLRRSSLRTLRVKNRLVAHIGLETKSKKKNAFLFFKIAQDDRD